MPDKRLGKGLEALITTHNQDSEYHLDGSIPMDKVKPNRNQPRKEFNSNEMSGLIESINNNGILQPVTVRELDNGEFELIAGERRYRAAEALGLTSIPAYIISINSDVEMMEYALIENIQRVDLDPIEEAEGYAILESKYGLTHKNIASKLGKKRSTITNALRLLKLPRDIKDSLISKKISSGHARAILSLKNLVQMKMVFKKILENNYSVRQTEELVKKGLFKKWRMFIVEELGRWQDDNFSKSQQEYSSKDKFFMSKIPLVKRSYQDLEDVEIRAKIDRIEHYQTQTGKTKVKIIDYKTGKKGSINWAQAFFYPYFLEGDFGFQDFVYRYILEKEEKDVSWMHFRKKEEKEVSILESLSVWKGELLKGEMTPCWIKDPSKPCHWCQKFGRSKFWRLDQ